MKLKWKMTKQIQAYMMLISCLLLSGCSASGEKDNALSPTLLTPTLTSSIDFALESEDIFCIYDGEKYGYISQSGEEIDYIYEMAYPFSDGLACVMLNGKYGAIDKEGKEVISFIYDDMAPFQEGLAYFSTEEEYGFMKKDGTVAFYLDCDSVSSFREGLAYFCIDGKYGYIDKNGKVAIAPVYSDADYFQDDIAFVNINGYKGAINKKGKEIISIKYDDIYRQEDYIIAKTGEICEKYSLTGELILDKDEPDIGIYSEEEQKIREGLEKIYEYVWNYYDGIAVVSDGTNYGLSNAQGKLLVPLNYDYILLFEDGSYLLQESESIQIYSNKQDLIYEEETIEYFNFYSDVSMIGDYYKLRVNNKLRVLDKNGTEILTIESDQDDNIYKENHNYIVNQHTQNIRDHILVMEECDDLDMSEILLKNSITPRQKLYWDKIREENTWNGDNYVRKAKLYDVLNKGIPVLYDCKEAIVEYNFGLSESALYFITENQLEQILLCGECGGSARGDRACFWRNQKNGELGIGYHGAVGGFGGYSTYSKVFSITDGVEEVLSYEWIGQHTSNYALEDLQEFASLFYDDENIPYTEDTIRSAEMVNEFIVDGERTSIEKYKEAQQEYISFDLY